MAIAEPEFPTFTLSETGERDDILHTAMSVSEMERWQHLGLENPSLTMQVILLSRRLTDEGASADQIAKTVAAYVNEVHRIEKTRSEFSSLTSANTELDTPSAEILEIDTAREKKTKLIKPRKLFKFGAALLIFTRSSAKNDKQLEI